MTASPQHHPDLPGATAGDGGERSRPREGELLSMLYELTAALSAAHTSSEVARVVLERGRAAFGASGAVVAVPVPGAPETLELVADFGFSAEAVDAWRRFPVDTEAPVPEAFRTGASVWVRDPDEARARYPVWAQAVIPGEDRAWLALPLEVEGHVLGAIGLAYHDARALDAADRELFMSIARKCAQALDRARLWEAEREARAAAEDARRRAEALAGMTTALNTALALEDVLRVALERSVQALAAADGALHLLADDGERVQLALELDPRRSAGGTGPGELSPALAEARDRGQPVLAAAAATLAVPLRGPERCLGVLELRLAAAGAPGDLAFARAVGDACALAIARASLYEAELAARARAEALEHEAKVASDRVARLQGVTAALSSAVTMRDVARVLFERGLEPLAAHAIGIVWMVRPHQLELLFGHGVSREEFTVLDRAARSGERLPIRDAILTRQPVWLESAEEIRARYPVLEPLRERRGESACAVVPLVVGSWCPGVIGLTFDRPRRFTGAERAFIGALAQLGAQAFERARLFEAEQEARREAERTTELQDRLMAVVGHDLRTPLSAVTMGAGLMLQRGGLSPAQTATLARVSHSAARMQAVVRDLLDYGRARRGEGISVRREPVDLGDLARRTLHEFEETWPDRAVPLAAQGDLRLDADPGRLAQVISNLVGNALQHGAGAPVRVELRGGEREVVLAVHNDGPPIAPDALERVFEPFQRGGDERRRSEGDGSVGLGLFIVRHIVAAHGGRVEVRSDAAAGTTFTVALPRRTAAEAAAAGDAAG